MTGLPDDPRIEQAVEAARDAIQIASHGRYSAGDTLRVALAAAWPLLRQVARDEAADTLRRAADVIPAAQMGYRVPASYCEGWGDAMDKAEQIVRGES